MILTLDELVTRLNPAANPNDTMPSEALWIKFAPYPKKDVKKSAGTVRTVDWRTPDDNTLVLIQVDQRDAILGIEIFP
jgi:hypothetical protein